MEPVGGDDGERERHGDARASRASAPASPPVSSTRSPSGSTTSAERTSVARLPNAPEPCVPVAVAPAMACVSTSPWFASPTPAARSGSPRSEMRVPAATTAVPRPASTSLTPVSGGQVEQQAVGRAQRREGVPGSGDAHLEVAARDEALHLGHRRRTRDLRGRQRDVAGPVAPRVHRRIVAGRASCADGDALRPLRRRAGPRPRRSARAGRSACATCTRCSPTIAVTWDPARLDREEVVDWIRAARPTRSRATARGATAGSLRRDGSRRGGGRRRTDRRRRDAPARRSALRRRDGRRTARAAVLQPQRPARCSCLAGRIRASRCRRTRSRSRCT